MQVFHGTILTCDENNTVANYLVEREGRIAYIGETLPTQYEVVPPIELGNNVMIPAFVDTHLHYSGFSVLHRMFPISDTDSNANILEQLKDYSVKVSSITVFISRFPLFKISTTETDSISSNPSARKTYTMTIPPFNFIFYHHATGR